MTSPTDGTAWITGASSGIGRATALRLARDGWTVIASARRAEALEALADEAAGLAGVIHPAPCDVTDSAQVATVVDDAERSHGPIALAILNAGTFEPDRAETMDSERFGRTVDLNLMGTVRCLEALMPHWLERGRGHAAVVSSVAGYCGLPRSLSYGATKAALINLCESLRFDFDRLGLKMQLVNPGFVRTPLTDKNDFPMPFLMEVDDAVDRLVRGLAADRFEIVFPRRFAWILKRLRCLPYRLYFPLVRRVTGQ